MLAVSGQARDSSIPIILEVRRDVIQGVRRLRPASYYRKCGLLIAYCGLRRNLHG